MKSPAILSAHNIMKETKKNQNKRLPSRELRPVQNVQSLDESLSAGLLAKFSAQARAIWQHLMGKS